MASSFLLSDAELHGIVDGHLPLHQRAEVLRRAATSSPDRERIAVFQEQADLLRGVFRAVAGEGVPSDLNLLRPLHGRGIAAFPTPRARRHENGARRFGIGWGAWTGVASPVLTLLLISGGLTGAWIIGMVPVEPTASRPTEAVMAQRTLSALAAYRKPVAAAAMPTTRIPDLSLGGFAFDGAESRSGSVPAILFRYRNGAAEQVFVAVGGAAEENATAPHGEGGVFAWRGKAKAYAVSGTLPPERLRLIAAAVREQAD